LRYSGSAAAFLRGFRALYLGLIFNVLVMGAVSLAAIKFGEVVLGLDGWVTLLIAGSITLAYSTLGGLKAVIVTDFVQFILAMIGSIWACYYVLNLEEVGGLSNLLAHADVVSKTSFLPSFDDHNVWIPILLVPLAVQWWASYYPGAEPGGGGYIAQRMFSAKDEKNAVGATLLYNAAHFALRPWPWILIALASIIMFPELDDIQRTFPGLSADKVGHDVAYPAMLTLLPSGLLGLVAASLIAAFMSTMSTQLNLGASYLVNDVYQRFINPDASQKQLVRAGQLFTILSAVLGLGLGLLLTSAGQAFQYLLLLGAGTGLIYILRWFWWRINAWTEIVAMIGSLIVAVIFTFGVDKEMFADWEKFLYGTLITTAIWVISTFITPPTPNKTLVDFYQKIAPGGPGWDKVRNGAKQEGITLKQSDNFLGLELACVLIGIIAVYAALFATGNLLYGNYNLGLSLSAVSILGAIFLFRAWGRMHKA